jgi:hypothetical protein
VTLALHHASHVVAFGRSFALYLAHIVRIVHI